METKMVRKAWCVVRDYATLEVGDAIKGHIA
jgi:hypothetical protein